MTFAVAHLTRVRSGERCFDPRSGRADIASHLAGRRDMRWRSRPSFSPVRPLPLAALALAARPRTLFSVRIKAPAGSRTVGRRHATNDLLPRRSRLVALVARSLSRGCIRPSARERFARPTRFPGAGRPGIGRKGFGACRLGLLTRPVLAPSARPSTRRLAALAATRSRSGTRPGFARPRRSRFTHSLALADALTFERRAPGCTDRRPGSLPPLGTGRGHPESGLSGSISCRYGERSADFPR